MNSKNLLLILLCIVICLVVGGFAVATFSNDNSDALDDVIDLVEEDNQSTDDTINQNTVNTKNHSKTNNDLENKVIVTQSGPSHAKEGQYVTINWTVKNMCNETIKNVTAGDQSFDHDFGEIKSGETKSVSFRLYISTLQEVKADFGEDAELSNPFFIGGFSLSYSLNGTQKYAHSNSIEIPLN